MNLHDHDEFAVPGRETPGRVPAGEAPDAELKPVTFTLTDQVMSGPDGNRLKNETISALRVHLTAQHIREGRRGMAVCGPAARSGASFMAANLALSLAHAGIKTLLIDADLRVPSLPEFIQPSRPIPGLCQGLAGDVPFGEIIHAEVVPSLSVIYAGEASRKASELLASDRFSQLIDLCAPRFRHHHRGYAAGEPVRGWPPGGVVVALRDDRGAPGSQLRCRRQDHGVRDAGRRRERYWNLHQRLLASAAPNPWRCLTCRIVRDRNLPRVPN